MASEPYWAEAPSRSTSMRSMAEAGIKSRSTGAPPRPDAGQVVDQRRAVPPLAVDQEQGLVAVQAAHGDGPHRPRGAAAVDARQVERRDQGVEHLLEADLAGGRQLLGGDHVDRGRAVGHGAAHAAHAGDDHALQRDRGVDVGGAASTTGKAAGSRPPGPGGEHRNGEDRGAGQQAGPEGCFSEGRARARVVRGKAKVYPPRGADDRRVVLLVSKGGKARRRPLGAPKVRSSGARGTECRRSRSARAPSRAGSRRSRGPRSAGPRGCPTGPPSWSASGSGRDARAS
jgi:hypothetical protein